MRKFWILAVALGAGVTTSYPLAALADPPLQVVWTDAARSARDNSEIKNHFPALAGELATAVLKWANSSARSAGSHHGRATMHEVGVAWDVTTSLNSKAITVRVDRLQYDHLPPSTTTATSPSPSTTTGASPSHSSGNKASSGVN